MSTATALSAASSETAPPTVPTLYERLGGEAAVESAVEIFYNRIIADSELAPFFQGVDMKKQRRKQVR